MKTTAAIAVLAIVASTSAAVVTRGDNCRCLPGDACWPSASAWSALNATVGGRLIATVSWTSPATHLQSSSSVMQAYFANQSCDPFTAPWTPCLLGNYVSYAVNVSSAADVAAALQFAQMNNIRIVIRNTGHDFLGRSTGAGGLAIWTHNLQDIEFLNWADSTYSGPAIKVGAGVIGATAVEAAHAQGLVVVTGECPTVGFAGGYTQGGGHSALSTSFGLAADQTLEFEVVTAAGQLVTASRTQNPDLFWALSGGGGGTYGVVLSLTVRAHPEAKVGGASLALTAALTTPANFRAAIAKLHSLLPTMTDQGASVVYVANDLLLAIKPVTVYNSTAEYVRDVVLAPFTSALVKLGIPFVDVYTELSYLDHYATYMGPLPYGSLSVESNQFGGRLVPRAVLEDQSSLAALNAAVQNLTANGVLIAGTAANYTSPPGVRNAALPAWQGATVELQLLTSWSETASWASMVELQMQMTNEFMPQIEAVTPGSGSYMNEADFRQPNWQDVFFGANYDQLLAVKNKWDPNNIFYILKGVGSEQWTVAEDGRMCHV